jgi:hypothetical protein
MASALAISAFKAREERIRVMVPARLRIDSCWSDACILNVSSRGLLIHSPQPVERGSYVELRRGDQVIVGRVMWRKGSRLGLRAQDRVSLQAIVTSAAARSNGAEPPPRAGAERRRVRREHDRSRMRGRVLEFASFAVIAATLAIVIGSMATQALWSPFSEASRALAGQASLEADSR